MEASRDVLRLVEIMQALRSPDGGCPWDVEQTFDTIAPYTIEEAYEVADAIERRNAADLCEELGDLLLQVVYHAQMASEAGLFTFDDVVEGITTKMIRRHPHVFGDVEARSARSAKGQWERIKAEERAEKAAKQALWVDRIQASGAVFSDGWQGSPPVAKPRLLDSVPGNLPALTLSLKIQQKAASVGFDWTSPEPIREKISEELEELDAAARDGDDVAMTGELGDILFSVVNLARFHEIDPETALRGCVAKFRRRFGHIEGRLSEDGHSLNDASLNEMEALWNEAKRLETAQPAAETRISG